MAYVQAPQASGPQGWMGGAAAGIQGLIRGMHGAQDLKNAKARQQAIEAETAIRQAEQNARDAQRAREADERRAAQNAMGFEMEQLGQGETERGAQRAFANYATRGGLLAGPQGVGQLGREMGDTVKVKQEFQRAAEMAKRMSPEAGQALLARTRATLQEAAVQRARDEVLDKIDNGIASGAYGLYSQQQEGAEGGDQENPLVDKLGEVREYLAQGGDPAVARKMDAQIKAAVRKQNKEFAVKQRGIQMFDRALQEEEATGGNPEKMEMLEDLRAGFAVDEVTFKQAHDAIHRVTKGMGPPEVTVPGLGKVQDNSGWSQGGYFGEMTTRQHAEMVEVARAKAARLIKDDPQLLTEKYIQAAAIAGETPKEWSSFESPGPEETSMGRRLLEQEVYEGIMRANGWREPPGRQTQQAPPGPAPQKGYGDLTKDKQKALRKRAREMKKQGPVSKSAAEFAPEMKVAMGLDAGASDAEVKKRMKQAQEYMQGVDLMERLKAHDMASGDPDAAALWGEKKEVAKK